MTLYIVTTGSPVEFTWGYTQCTAPNKWDWINYNNYHEEDAPKIETCKLDITNAELPDLLECLRKAEGDEGEVIYAKFNGYMPAEIKGKTYLEIYNDYRE